MTLIPDIFPKLLNPEYLIIYMSEKSIFRGPFDTQHVKQPQRTAPVWTTAPLRYLVSILKLNKLENFSSSDLQNFITVC